MRSLHQFPPGDLLANENWPELKHSLQKTLKDPNASLSVCCLYIYIITSYCGMHNITYYSYINKFMLKDVIKDF